MVDRTKRDEASQLISRFMNCEITNDEFEDAFPREKSDPALWEMRMRIWGFYSDLSKHKLEGRHALRPDGKAMFNRCILFLNSNLEYEWPTSDIRLLNLFLHVVSFGWYTRQKTKEYKRHGDFDVWPFLRRSDYETHLSIHAPQAG